MRLIAGLLLSAGVLAAQLHVGLKGGVPLADLTETVSAPNFRNLPPRWTLGLMVDVDLPLRLGIEVDALYRRAGYEYPARVPLGTPPQTSQVKEGFWDFPVIAKYRFGSGAVRPYLGAGWSYRKLSDLLRPASSSNGFTVAAGVAVRALVVRLAPEFRYTRWGSGDPGPDFRAARNQAELLVGFSF
jgi:hypothetical protein